jgi:hypothetical protein
MRLADECVVFIFPSVAFGSFLRAAVFNEFQKAIDFLHRHVHNGRSPP